MPAETDPLSSVAGLDTSCSSNQQWSTLDLTGDGRPDLVLTSSCADATVGASHWMLYPNQGSGFAATATAFGLPALAQRLSGVSGVNTSCANNQEWSTLDLTGDGKSDLVLTRSCADAAVGTMHWLVYANQGSGFAATPTEFALPTLATPVFAIAGDSLSCPSGAGVSQVWSLLDLTGDGKLDLVVTSSCADASTSKTHWEVYANTGSGFATTATSFALPTLELPMNAVTGSASCGADAENWATVDLSGDGKPDLVVTSRCSDTTVSKTHWQLFPNMGAGFAPTAQSFGLPSLDTPVDSTAGMVSACNPGENWTLLDVTGDHKPDLVLTRSCSDMTVGISQWLVYANGGSSFASAPAPFTIPALAQPLSATAGLNTNCTDNQTWSTLDLLGDGKLDLVLTSSCPDSTVGRTHWSVYGGTCSP